MHYGFTEAPLTDSAVLMATPGGYPPNSPGYQAPPPGYIPPAPSGGLSVGAASALCYLFGFISGIIFLVLEPYKRDPVVRFHAFQSIFLNLSVLVISFAWNLVAGMLDAMTHGIFIFVHMIVSAVIGIGFLVVWVILMVRAAQGTRWVLPVVGPLAERQAGTVAF